MTTALPPGWLQQFDPNSGRHFYVDTNVNPPVSHWHLPQGFQPPQMAPTMDTIPIPPTGQPVQPGQPVMVQQVQPGQPVQPVMVQQVQPGQPVMMQQAQPVQNPVTLLSQALPLLQQAAQLLQAASTTQAAQLGVNMVTPGSRGGVGRMMINASQKSQAEQANRLATQASQLISQAQQLDPSIMIQPPDVKSIGGIITQGLFDSPGFDAIRTAKLSSSRKDVLRCAQQVQQAINQRGGMGMANVGQPVGQPVAQPVAQPVQQPTQSSGSNVGKAVVGGMLLGRMLRPGPGRRRRF